MKLPQKVSLEPETCEILRKVWFLASGFCLLRLGVRHRAARHASAVFEALCCCLKSEMSCFLVSFKGSHSLISKFTQFTQSPRVPVYKHSDFVHRLIPKRSEIDPQKTSQNLICLKKLSFKTHSRSRPRKRRRPKGAKPLKNTIVTHFQLFLKRPRASTNTSK